MNNNDVKVKIDIGFQLLWHFLSVISHETRMRKDNFKILEIKEDMNIFIAQYRGREQKEER
jgi:hypothetical protein